MNERRVPVIGFSAWGCCIGALMILIGVVCRTHWVLSGSGMLLMAFAGNISPIYVALLKESNDSNRFGTVICVGNCLAYAISALFGGCAGKLMDFYSPQIVNGVKVYGRESYILVFSVLALLGLLAALLSLAIKESRGKDISGQFDS